MEKTGKYKKFKRLKVQLGKRTPPGLVKCTFQLFFFCKSVLSLLIRLVSSWLISIIFTFESFVEFLASALFEALEEFSRFSSKYVWIVIAPSSGVWITLNFWRFFCQNAPKYFVNNRLNYFLSTVLLLLTLNVWWLLFMNKRLF